MIACNFEAVFVLLVHFTFSQVVLWLKYIL